MTALSRPQPYREPHGLLGHSPALKQVKDQLREVAPTDLTVLLLGETGTGKGVAAHALHPWSRRPHQPFVHLDCSSLPPSLLDSELFGHEKGAFTGASLIGGLPMLVYTLALLALGHVSPTRSGLEPGEIFTPALRNFLLWNLPNLLLLQPLSNGALVAAVAQLQRQEPLQPITALRTALQARKGLFSALGLFWLINAAAFLTIYWTFGHSEPPAWQSLGGIFMIALAMAFPGYWWFRWTFLTQAVILGGCGPREAFGHSSRLVASAWGRIGALFLLRSVLPGFLDNLLGLVGPWAVIVGQSLTAPLSTVGMTLRYWELRERGEEKAEEVERA